MNSTAGRVIHLFHVFSNVISYRGMPLVMNTAGDTGTINILVKNKFHFTFNILCTLKLRPPPAGFVVDYASHINER